MSMKLKLAALTAVAAVVAAMPAHAGKTLDGIKAKGQVTCGVNVGLAGFSAADSSGNWSGMDVDACKAVAAAVLGDANKVKYVPLTHKKSNNIKERNAVCMSSIWSNRKRRKKEHYHYRQISYTIYRSYCRQIRFHRFVCIAKCLLDAVLRCACRRHQKPFENYL